MQSIKLILPILFFFTVGGVFGQDEIYPDNKKKEKKEEVTQGQSTDEKVDLDAYSTEMDYNQANRSYRNQNNNDDYWEEEIYQDEDERRRSRDNGSGELVAQIVFEVVVNSLFIIATFWH